MTTTLFEQNIKKCHELLPEVWWAAEAGVKECFDLNLRFSILKVFRSQDEQNKLWAIGRRGVKGEDVVTKTLRSKHTLHLAMDIKPINCTYEDVEQVFARYGITHPFITGNFIDLPHFEFDRVGQKPYVLNHVAARKRAERRAKRLKEPAKSRLLKRLIPSHNSL